MPTHGYEATLTEALAQAGQTLQTLTPALARRFLFYAQTRWAMGLPNSTREREAFARVGVHLSGGTAQDSTAHAEGDERTDVG